MIFYKYHGTGNDFILIDNRNKNHQLSSPQINFLCEQHFGVGADGLIMIEPHQTSDFYMSYYNSDGKSSSMCGNGGRCAVLFAKQLGIFEGTSCTFHAADGIHHANVIEGDQIALRMNVDTNYEIHGTAYILDTGSPHYVRFKYNLDQIDMNKEGKVVRYSAAYKKTGGINVNFVEETDKGIFVRTYERGVEAETLSCGTGVTAASLAYFFKERKSKSSVVHVETLGGSLRVQIEIDENQQVHSVWLIGPAQEVFIGEIDI